jgi:hypothetical protein
VKDPWGNPKPGKGAAGPLLYARMVSCLPVDEQEEYGRLQGREWRSAEAQGRLEQLWKRASERYWATVHPMRAAPECSCRHCAEHRAREAATL